MMIQQSEIPGGTERSLGRTVRRAARGLALAAGMTALTPLAMAQGRQPAPPAAAPQETVVRLVGAASVGSKMTMTAAMSWAKQQKLSGVRVEPGVDPDEYEVVAEGAESTKRLRVYVKAKGTGFGLEQLLRGEIDFWMAAREIRESDLAKMRKAGVPNVPTLEQMRTPGIENVVALSAMAVVVNQRNPVQQLSYAQLRDIYQGRISSWAQVGGPSNMPIGLYSPEPTLATSDFFCAAVMGLPETLKCLDSFARLAAPRITLMDDISDAVAGNPAGISFVDYGSRRSSKPIALANECGTGIEPSLFRIKTDEYSLTRKHHYYIHPTRPLSPAAKDFLAHVLGPQGQQAAVAAGLADLSPGVADGSYGGDRLDAARETMDGGRTRVRMADVRAFETATSGAERLTITFRFQAGTNALDSRAEADITRLAQFLAQPANVNTTVSLIGFSGSAGDYTENRTLSSERANAVRERLMAAGVTSVNAVGVGPTAAIACNLDPAQAVLNQRVEVWLRRNQRS